MWFRTVLTPLVFLTALLLANAGVAERQYRNANMERVLLATEVPHNPEAYIFTVTGVIDGVTYYPENVPLVDLTYGASMPELATLAVGTVVTPEVFRSFRGRLFYGIRLSEEGEQEQEGRLGWIDGRYLALSRKEAD